MAAPTLATTIPGFSVLTSLDKGVLRMDCTGTLEADDAAELLSEELLDLHERVVASGVTAVMLSFKQLTYMNSGGIKAFAAWFTKVENAGSPSYTIEAHHDPTISWQGWSLAVLQRMAPNAIRLVPPRR